MKLNLPSKLTVLRMILTPICMIVIVCTLIPETWARIIAAAIFILTSFTDFLDGMIARKFNMITDFGKFLDPIADKLLVIGTLLAVTARFREDALFVNVMIWVIFICVMREIAVTSLRMIASGNNVVVPANIFGKLKTVSQILGIVVLLLEPIILPQTGMAVTYIMLALMTLLTLISGATYFKALWSYIDPQK